MNKLTTALPSIEAVTPWYAHSEHGKGRAPVIIHLHDWTRRHLDVMLEAINEDQLFVSAIEPNL
jgi:hypothetical protein